MVRVSLALKVSLICAILFAGLAVWSHNEVHVFTGSAPSAIELTPLNPDTKSREDILSPQLVVNSEWKQYRNEKHGFEFKLPMDYDIPVNVKNGKRIIDGVSYLNDQNGYVFSSGAGLKQLENISGFGAGGDANDQWRVTVNIREYSPLFRDDFKNWVFRGYGSDETDVQTVGEKLFPNGTQGKYFCWVSIGDDCSVFFTDENIIVEMNSQDVGFVANEGYFFSILSTFHFMH